MDMKDVEIQKKHLGEGGYLELKDENGTVKKYYIPQILAEDIPEYFYIVNKIQKSPDNPLEALDREGVKILVGLIKKTLKRSDSFKDYTDEQIDAFIVAHLLPIVKKLFEICDLGARYLTADMEAIKRAKTIRRLRENVGEMGQTEGEGKTEETNE